MQKSDLRSTLIGCLLAASFAGAGYAQGAGEPARPTSPSCDLDCVVADIVATAGRMDGGDVFDPTFVAASMLVDIATVLAQRGDVDRAADMVAELAELPRTEAGKNRQRARANLSLAEGHAAAGRAAEADGLLEQAAAVIDTLRYPSWHRSELARALLRTGRTAAARQALAAIDDAQGRAPALADMAVASAEAGDVDAARRMLAGAFRAVAEQARAGMHSRISAYSTIAAGLVAVGAVDEALALAATVAFEVDVERVGAMAGIAVAQHEAGMTEAAQETLFHALAIADTIAEGHTRAWALRAIVDGGDMFNHRLPGDPPAGNRSVAGPSVALALKAMAAAIDPPSRNEALTIAVTALARAGEHEAALATAAEVGDVCSGAHALAAIATAQVAAGEVDEAIATADRIGTPSSPARRDCGYKDGALEAIATAQAEDGRIDGAFATLADIERDGARLGALAAIGKALAKDLGGNGRRM